MKVINPINRAKACWKCPRCKRTAKTTFEQLALSGQPICTAGHGRYQDEEMELVAIIIDGKRQKLE